MLARDPAVGDAACASEIRCTNCEEQASVVMSCRSETVSCASALQSSSCADVKSDRLHASDCSYAVSESSRHLDNLQERVQKRCEA